MGSDVEADGRTAAPDRSSGRAACAAGAPSRIEITASGPAQATAGSACSAASTVPCWAGSARVTCAARMAGETRASCTAKPRVIAANRCVSTSAAARATPVARYAADPALASRSTSLRKTTTIPRSLVRGCRAARAAAPGAARDLARAAAPARANMPVGLGLPTATLPMITAPLPARNVAETPG